jgi:EthD domain
MSKLVALMQLRPDIKFDAARRIYECEHVPLVLRLMPMIREYRRNYLVGSDFDSVRRPDFQVIAELWFDSTSHLEEFVQQMRYGEAGRRLRDDSARFLLRGTTRMFVVDETASQDCA